MYNQYAQSEFNMIAMSLKGIGQRPKRQAIFLRPIHWLSWCQKQANKQAILQWITQKGLCENRLPHSYIQDMNSKNKQHKFRYLIMISQTTNHSPNKSLWLIHPQTSCFFNPYSPVPGFVCLRYCFSSLPSLTTACAFDGCSLMPSDWLVGRLAFRFRAHTRVRVYTLNILRPKQGWHPER